MSLPIFLPALLLVTLSLNVQVTSTYNSIYGWYPLFPPHSCIVYSWPHKPRRVFRNNLFLNFVNHLSCLTLQSLSNYAAWILPSLVPRVLQVWLTSHLSLIHVSLLLPSTNLSRLIVLTCIVGFLYKYRWFTMSTYFFLTTSFTFLKRRFPLSLFPLFLIFPLQVQQTFTFL